MHTLINNGKLSAEIPEDFILLNDKTTSADGGKDNSGSWTIQDEKRHMVINIGWRDVPYFGRKTPMDRVLKNTVKKFKTKVLGFVERKYSEINISGRHAYGYRYSYHANDTENMSEFILLKYEEQYLVFVFICQEKDFYDYYSIFEAFLKTVKL